MPREIQFSTATFAGTIAKKWMFVIVSANVGEDSPVRNAPIADAVQPETINSNGVFRVTSRLGAFLQPETRCKTKRGKLAEKFAPSGKIELGEIEQIKRAKSAGNWRSYILRKAKVWKTSGTLGSRPMNVDIDR